MKFKKAWGALVILALLTPLGIIAVGGAWGEWRAEAIKERVGFVPEGMRESENRSRAKPFEDYVIPGLGNGSWRKRMGVVGAALIGAGTTALATHAIARVARHGRVS